MSGYLFTVSRKTYQALTRPRSAGNHQCVVFMSKWGVCLPAFAYSRSPLLTDKTAETSFVMWNLAFKYAATVVPPMRAAAAVPGFIRLVDIFSSQTHIPRSISVQLKVNLARLGQLYRSTSQWGLCDLIQTQMEMTQRSLTCKEGRPAMEKPPRCEE